jgi:hypothetical protein
MLAAPLIVCHCLHRLSQNIGSFSMLPRWCLSSLLRASLLSSLPRRYWILYGRNHCEVWLLQIARVTLLDPQGAKRDYLASVVGLLRSKDLAVLKIEAPASILKPAVIGTSADVRVGQQVLAIGNPFGFDHTLTTGAISGLDRVIQSQAGVVAARFMHHHCTR